MSRERDSRGRFIKGNEIGLETRIKKGEVLRTVYDDSYPEDILDYFRHYEGYPTLEGWCEDRDIYYNTALYWTKSTAETYALFVDAYAQCKMIQRRRLLEGGLSGRYNPQFSKFVASACHGMSERVEQDNNVTVSVKIDDSVDEYYQ